jgi:hypothetical protein
MKYRILPYVLILLPAVFATTFLVVDHLNDRTAAEQPAESVGHLVDIRPMPGSGFGPARSQVVTSHGFYTVLGTAGGRRGGACLLNGRVLLIEQDAVDQHHSAFRWYRLAH